MGGQKVIAESSSLFHLAVGHNTTSVRWSEIRSLAEGFWSPADDLSDYQDQHQGALVHWRIWSSHM